MKNILNNLVRVGLSAVLLWWLSTKIDFVKTANVVKSADLVYIFYALVLFMVINFVLISRWFVFIKALDLKVGFGTAARYYLIGLFGNLFMPSAIGGDVIKIVGLCHGSQDKPKVVASVLVDRLSGFAGMVVVATVSFIFGFRLIADASIALAIVAMAVVSTGIGMVLFNQTAYSFCCQIFGRFPKFKDSLMRMHYDIALLKGRKSAIYQAIGLSILSQVLLAVTFFLVSCSFHQSVSLIYFIIFIPLICVLSTVPSIGGLGVREAGAAYFLGKVGVASGVAVSISLINFLFMVLIGLLGGIYFLLTQPKKDIS
ncbi:MAG: flippase-like domain-containing protein [Candidatus Omnitrophica bacterium]|nr:flippase-like domain-containing protein [Candidatus Omnitrophota bacterium]